MNDRKIEQSVGAALLGNNFCQFHGNFISREKKVTRRGPKTLLTLELSQYCKSGSMFSSSEPVAARSDCCLFCSGTAFGEIAR